MLCVVLASFAFAASAQAAALLPLNGTNDPIFVTAPPGDGGLWVVERGGAIRIFRSGVLRPAPFLTVPNVDTSGERGLLSMAFPPDYQASRLFYAFAVAAGPDPLDSAGETGAAGIDDAAMRPARPPRSGLRLPAQRHARGVGLRDHRRLRRARPDPGAAGRPLPVRRPVSRRPSHARSRRSGSGSGPGRPERRRSLVSFGQDSRGCVYAVADGTVYRVAKQADGHPYCSLPVS